MVEIHKEEFKIHKDLTMREVLEHCDDAFNVLRLSFDSIGRECKKGKQEQARLHCMMMPSIYSHVFGIWKSVDNKQMTFGPPIIEHIIIPDRLDGIWVTDIFEYKDIAEVFKILFIKSLIPIYLEKEKLSKELIPDWDSLPKAQKDDFFIRLQDELDSKFEIHYTVNDKDWTYKDKADAIMKLGEDIDCVLRSRERNGIV